MKASQSARRAPMWRSINPPYCDIDSIRVESAPFCQDPRCVWRRRSSSANAVQALTLKIAAKATVACVSREDQKIITFKIVAQL
jgi:hypothetical protein